MARLTRRRFLATGAVASATTAGAILGVNQVAKVLTNSDAATAEELSAGASAGPMVAYVRHPESGELGLLVGNREVIVKDRDLVARLLRATH